ncbi:MAG: ATP-binding protein, partial [Acidobacteriota bacterium]|nr:ATP-binding protein [Acidobacteriota bacterium]
MSATDTQLDWAEANQRYLTAALAVVRQKLKQPIGAATREMKATTPDVTAADETLSAAADAMPAPAAIDTLCATFGLSPFERDVLLLCAGVELDANFS